MFRRAKPVPATDPAGPVAIDQPHDTCFRCGRPTPLGVSLCEHDNPGQIGSPSATQVHGTIVVGVLGGFVLLALLLRLSSGGIGPFTSAVSGVATRSDGGLEVVIRVANGGERASGASCRISPAGAPGYADHIFFTESIPAGGQREFTRTVLAPAGSAPLRAESVVVRCN